MSSLETEIGSPAVIRQRLNTYQVGVSDGSNVQFLYSVYDNTIKQFSPPTCALSGFVIGRGFAEMVRANPNSPFALYPSHFLLYYVGRMNTTTGSIEASAPVFLGSIKSIIEAITPDDLAAFIASVDSLLAPQVKL